MMVDIEYVYWYCGVFDLYKVIRKIQHHHCEHFCKLVYDKLYVTLFVFALDERCILNFSVF